MGDDDDDDDDEEEEEEDEEEKEDEEDDSDGDGGDDDDDNNVDERVRCSLIFLNWLWSWISPARLTTSHHYATICHH